MIAIARAARGRMKRVTDDADRGVAMLIAIIFMMLLTSLTIMTLGVIVNQPKAIYTVQRASKTVYAAQAGLQVALGQIRSAAAAPDATGKIYGTKTKLPCTLSGSVDGSTDSTSYTVTLSYFATNPAGQSATWQAANKYSCSSASGVATTPGFALIVSQGSASSITGLADTVANRGVQGVYAFDVTNVNIPGDLVLDAAQGYCLYAVSATTGSLVKYQPVASCTTDTLDKWVYTTTYQLELASTIGTSTPLCITGPTTLPYGTQSAVLTVCQTDSTRWNQLWSWTGSYTWFGQLPTITGGNSTYCLGSGQGTATNLTGKYLQVLAACGVSGTFYPKSGVGAGGASVATKQLVNYKEFGRCADVTNQDYTSAFYITYPCKQDPTGTNNFTWNQQFNYTEPTLPATSVSGIEIWTNNGNVTGSPRQCLTTNGTAYPKLTNCTTTPTAAQAWTRYYDTGSYSNSYIITDMNGKCLGVDPTTTYSGWSAITVTACDTTTAQKWNAKAQSTSSTFGSFKELG